MYVAKQKSRKTENKTTWKIGDDEIEECENYKYLGVTFKSNGTFAMHVDKIKEKAQKLKIPLDTFIQKFVNYNKDPVFMQVSKEICNKC